MKIDETINEVLTIKPLDNQLRPSSKLHPDLLQPPFSLLVVSPKGSGKSTCIVRLLYGNRKKKGCTEKTSHHKFY